MTQGLLSLLGVLHKMQRHLENLLTKYDPVKVINVEDHLDNFYIHLHMLEVHYDNFASRLFPCTLYGRETSYYYSLLANSIQNWRGFKKLFL